MNLILIAICLLVLGHFTHSINPFISWVFIESAKWSIIGFICGFIIKVVTELSHETTNEMKVAAEVTPYVPDSEIPVAMIERGGYVLIDLSAPGEWKYNTENVQGRAASSAETLFEYIAKLFGRPFP